jgi:hypothetical protein
MSLWLTVKNLGPIYEAELELSQLSVLVGPNNTGKSFLAMLAYAATRPAPLTMPLFGGSYSTAMNVLMSRRQMMELAGTPAEYDVLASLTSDFLEKHIAGKQPSIPEPLVVYMRRVLKVELENYGKAVAAEIHRTIGAPLNELNRLQDGKRHQGHFVIESDDSARWSVRLEPARSGVTITTEFNGETEDLLARALELFDAEAPDVDSSLWQLIMRTTIMQFLSLGTTTRYLPAGRSGYLQVQKPLAASVLSGSSWTGIAPFEQRMPAVIADFLSEFIAMDSERQSPLVDLADDLERDVLGGLLRMSTDQGGNNEVSYDIEGEELPLSRASSMVSELAPIVLYFRHVLDRSETVLLEEPEAHLHPRSQVTLARVIAAATNRGVRMLLTTHSDYFLASLNNSIRASALSDSENLDHAHGSALRAETVSAYILRRRSEGGTIVDRLAISEMSGIPEDEFARVTEELYSETAQLERQLRDER